MAAALTCIISRRDTPRRGDSPLRGGSADIMMRLRLSRTLGRVTLRVLVFLVHISC